MAESLVLRSGYAPWLRRAQLSVAAMAVLALLSSDTASGWIAAAIAALAAVTYVVNHRTDPAACRGRLHLADDGCGVLFTASGVRPIRQRGGGWISRWVCVLPLSDAETGARLSCVVCASLNREAGFRRLLRHQRAGAWRGVAGGAP